MDRLSEEVRGELRRLGPSGAIGDVVAVWPEAVGMAIAANAWPARIARDGTLLVHTSSSTWAFELTQMGATVLERLREDLGEAVPRSVRFSIGHLPEPSTQTASAAGGTPLSPAPEAARQAADLTAGVEDDALRERIARAAALSLSTPRDDHPL